MKERIAIMADSACDLPREIVAKYDIKIIPLKVIYPEGEFSDGIDIEPSEVYSRMPAEIPTTSMPNLQEIKAMIEKIKKAGYTHLLSIHLSSNLSGTYNAVKMATKDITDLTIEVFDSKTLSMGTGWIVLECARALANNCTFAEIVEKLPYLQSRVSLFYVIETLEYLRKGGRIGQVAGMLGEFMNLKPIISVNDEGTYYTYCKARGRNKSISKLIDIVEKRIHNQKVKLAIMHGGAQEEGEKLLNKLKQLPNLDEIIFTDISPALGVHTGPGLLGIGIFQI